MQQTYSRSRRLPWTGIAALGLTLFLAMTWALASPPGSSPDDDFHLASIWCSWGADAAGCTVLEEPAPTDHLTVSVPDLAIESSHCAAFKPEVSGGCSYLNPDGSSAQPDPEVYVMRANNRSYPELFYAMMRPFVVDSAATSVVLMRLASAVLGIALLVAAGLLTVPDDRWRLWAYWLVGSVPLGLFTFASTNPSSLAIAGAAAVFPLTLAALQSDGEPRRRWIASSLAAVSAILAVGSRSDAVFFCGLAVAAALVVSLRGRRGALIRGGLSALPVASVLIVAFITRNGAGLAAGAGAPAPGRVAPTTDNIVGVLSFYVGEFATRLGWLDVAVPSLAWGSIALALGAILGYGVGGLGARRAIAVGATLAVALTLPIVMLERTGYRVGEWVQPRYLLPGVMVLLGILAIRGADGTAGPNRRQLIWVAALASLAHTIALHRLMRRYITGVDGVAFDLGQAKEWWWDIGVGPMAVWALGSLAFSALALTVAIRAGASVEAPAGRTSVDQQANIEGDPTNAPA